MLTKVPVISLLDDSDEDLDELATRKRDRNESGIEQNAGTKDPFPIFKRKKSPLAVIYCPVCNLMLKDDSSILNMHLDVCIQKRELAMSSPTKLTHNKTYTNILAAPEVSIEEHSTISGLWILHNFISEKEEADLIQQIDGDLRTPWKKSSFNGNCNSKVYGVRTQFGLPNEIRQVRENDPAKGEYPLPDFIHFVMDRLKLVESTFKCLFPHDLRSFRPNECNINSYEISKGHYLKYHYDDRSLSGPLLVNLSLLGRAKMTYVHPVTKETLDVDLPRRCIQLISQSARWDFMHGIKAEHLFDERRVSITIRQCGGKRGIEKLPAAVSVIQIAAANNS